MTINLSREDSALLKGLAILGIVLHNFAHWLPGCVVENEYMFSASNTWHLLRVLGHGGPHVVLNLFSYFGHYGVPVFLFVSGYGLVKKYERPERPAVRVAPFLGYNVLKLWRLMVPAVLLLLLSELFRCGGWLHGVSNVVYLFTFVTNFLPSARDALLPHRDLLLGPWWYFSLTLQMYLLWRLAYYRHGRTALLVSAAVCLGAQVLATTVWADPSQAVLDYLRYNLVGCLLPFALGVWVARYGLRLTPALWAGAAALLVAGCFNVFLWMLTPLCAVVVLLPAVRLGAGPVRRAVVWMGGLSAALFAVHPVVRDFFIIGARRGAVVSGLLLYLLFAVGLACLLTVALRHVRLPKY